MTDTIDSFTGEFAFLSNFHPSPIQWPFAPVMFPTVEHGFVWHKTLNDVDREMILAIDTPGKVKRFGRRNITLREDWDIIKLSVMQELVFLKFAQNKQLRDKLLATDDSVLIEGNHWGDTFWGVCDGHGENNLGKTLMRVRDILRRIAR